MIGLFFPEDFLPILWLLSISLALISISNLSLTMLITLTSVDSSWSSSIPWSSFSIWLARNNKEWTPPTTSCKLNDSSKETYNSQSSMSSLKQTTKPGSNAKSFRPVGFINEDNTLCQFHLADFKCYTHPLE